MTATILVALAALTIIALAIYFQDKADEYDRNHPRKR